MGRQKRHANRVYQVIGEPGPGAICAGYARYSSEMQDPATIVTQKRKMQEFATKKGWTIVRWYEEPEQSGKYEDIEDRPVFAQLLRDAGREFQVVLCYLNNRWARNVAVAYISLSQLRRKRVWWATSDGMWDIDKVQQDGFDVAFAVDTQMNATYVRNLSKVVIDAKESRARDGYHNGQVPFGYLPPEYPKAPDGAPSTWKPPRMPVRRDPVNFPALVRLGELAAAGWSDAAIADELAGHVSTTPRYGQRLLTKDTVAAIRRLWFPREFAPGSGHGTIETPSGELVEGRHPAAWPYELWQRLVEAKAGQYELWQRLVEAKAGQYRRPQRHAVRRPREFSRIVVCAGCRRPLRVQSYIDAIYYRDMSIMRKLPCPAVGSLSVKSEKLARQFGELLASVKLPETWREAIADLCQTTHTDDHTERILARRSELESEQKRLVAAFAKGYLSECDLDDQVARLREELRALPVPELRNVEELTLAAIQAGETFADMAGYWVEATPEERRDMVWSLLNLEGLVYDLERASIVGLVPRPDMAPILALGLADQWEVRDGGLWLRASYWPEKQVREYPHQPPRVDCKLNAEQRAQVRELARAGTSLRQLATLFNVSRMAIFRVIRADRADAVVTHAEMEGDTTR